MPDITGNAAIDTAVGLFFVFFILSIICSAVVEIIAGILKLRARDLERGVRNLLDDDPSTTIAFFENPRIRALWRRGGKLGDRKPSYMPARAFAMTFLDTVAPQGQPGERNVLKGATETFDDLEESLTGVPSADELEAALSAARAELNGELAAELDAVVAELNDLEAKSDREQRLAVARARTAFKALEPRWPRRKKDAFTRVMRLFDGQTVVATVLRDALQTAKEAATTGEEQIALVRASIEKSFDEVMDRASGWYKRRAQVILLAVAFVVAGVANADSLAITQRLYKDDALRAAVVAEADKLTDKTTCPGVENATEQADGSLKRATDCVDTIERLGLPLGWSADTTPHDGGAWLAKFVGLLMTVLALSLGAPFWFDLLGKLAQLRGVGNREGTGKTDSAAEDRDDPGGLVGGRRSVVPGSSG